MLVKIAKTAITQLLDFSKFVKGNICGVSSGNYIKKHIFKKKKHLDDIPHHPDHFDRGPGDLGAMIDLLVS